jgi:hypothetical protein
MQALTIRLIIYFGSKNIPEFIRLLAKLEYGVSAFLENLASCAEDENYPHLANQLKNHASEERNHGKMLATLVDGKQRIELRNNGRWKTLIKDGVELANHPESGDGRLIVFDEGYGIFDNLDGISQRYLGLRMLLKGQKLVDLDWQSRIAVMAVLEESTLSFYNQLSVSPNIPNEVRLVAVKIAGQEAEHGNYLKYVLPQFTYLPEMEIEKWQARLLWASWGLMWDFWRWRCDSSQSPPSK